MTISKFIKSFLTVACLYCFIACSQDEPYEAVQDDNLSVTINSDGTTNNGAVYSQIDDTTFFLDYVKYKFEDSHLAICGYDSIQLSESPKLYANVNICNTAYKTTRIDSLAFSFAKISSIVLPKTIKSIGYAAFSCCYSLTNISLPDNLTHIDICAFVRCTSLTQISLPDALSYLGDYAFYKCTSLTNISLPDAISFIGEYAFSDCTSLSEISLPDALSEIRTYAFFHCSSLTQITFPQTLSYVGLVSFGNCFSIEKVTFLGLKPPTFYHPCFTSQPTAYVRPEALKEYREWSEAHYFHEILPISD